MLVSNYDGLHRGVVKAIQQFKEPDYKYSRFAVYENLH